MEFNQTHVNTIINARNNDNLVVFIGAGVSKFSESESSNIKFPTWGELINTMKKDLATEETDYLKVAQLYYLKFGEYSLYEKIKSMVPLHASPSNIHEKIFELNPKYVITTNWDNILEKTIEQNGHIYDIIKSDADLVKSILPRKLVKVHGDLTSHNIVFKEDDYLTYGDNFPLIENFLRHILSSYTVLFLGYSYSDYDLKIISKWIERRSKVAPPRYILALSENATENMYLKSHGIQSIFPSLTNSKEEVNYDNLYDNFLDRIGSENNIPNDLLFAVESLKKDDEFTLDEHVKVEVVEFFYEQLRGLLEFKALIPQQITNVLSNCTVKYHINCFGLWFHDGVLTTDYEENQRKIYKLFFQIIKSYNGYEDLKKDKLIYQKLTNILEVFYLANCLFITNENMGDSSWVSIEKLLPKSAVNNLEDYENNYDKFLDFSHPNLELLGVYNFYNEDGDYESYDKLIDTYNSQMYKYLANKEFYNAVISMFNINSLNRKRMIALSSKLQDIVNSEDTKWKDKLKLYPSNTKKHMLGLYEFLSLNLLYQIYYELSKEIEKLSKNQIINPKAYFLHDTSLQLLTFTALNEILIDEHQIFVDLMKLSVQHKIKVLLDVKNEREILPSPYDKHIIDKHDLFILIKYYDFKKIDSIFNKIYSAFEEKEIKINCQEHEGYLLNTFENLINLYKYENSGIFSSRISHSLVNIILICALVYWEGEGLTHLVKLIKSCFSNNPPYDAYKALNLYIFYNYKIFNIKVEDLSPLLDIPLEKVLSDKLSFSELQALNNELQNLYGVFDETGIIYQNKVLLKRVIGSLKPLDNIEYKRDIASKILIKYLFIIEDEMVKQLHDFINSVRIKDWSKDIDDKYVFEELTFNFFGLKVNESFIKFLDSYLNEEAQKHDEQMQEAITEAEEVSDNTMRTKLLWSIKTLNDKGIPEYTHLYNKYSS